MAVVLLVTPSPTAPKLRMLFVPGGIVGNAGEAAWAAGLRMMKAAARNSTKAAL
jgi:hypothetical protein